MFRFLLTIVFAALLGTAALPEGTQLDRARALIKAGDYEAALEILVRLPPQSRGVVQALAHAHVMVASRASPPERCDHLQKGIEFGIRAHDVHLVELARKRMRDESC